MSIRPGRRKLGPFKSTVQTQCLWYIHLKLLNFILIMYVRAIMWGANVVQVSVENRGDRCRWTWSYRWLQAASPSHVGAENWTPGFFERTAWALNHWTISVAQNFFYLSGSWTPGPWPTPQLWLWTLDRGIRGTWECGNNFSTDFLNRGDTRYSYSCFLLILLPSHGWVFAPPAF